MILRRASNIIDDYFTLEDAFYYASDGILSFYIFCEITRRASEY